MKVPIENLLKGRATEVVFEQMFGNKKQYKVLHFGFEYITAELKGAIRGVDDETFKMISKAPDFLLHDTEEHSLYLVECKYRTKVQAEDILYIAKQLDEKNWSLSKLFIASPDGFFYDDVENIIANKGECPRLSCELVSEATQEKYLAQLLSMFESN